MHTMLENQVEKKAEYVAQGRVSRGTCSSSSSPNGPGGNGGRSASILLQGQVEGLSVLAAQAACKANIRTCRHHGHLHSMSLHQQLIAVALNAGRLTTMGKRATQQQASAGLPQRT
jgi:hypothetical protein